MTRIQGYALAFVISAWVWVGIAYAVLYVADHYVHYHFIYKP